MRTFTVTFELEADNALGLASTRQLIVDALNGIPETPYIDYIDLIVVCSTCDAGDPTSIIEVCECSGEDDD